MIGELSAKEERRKKNSVDVRWPKKRPRPLGFWVAIVSVGLSPLVAYWTWNTTSYESRERISFTVYDAIPSQSFSFWVTMQFRVDGPLAPYRDMMVKSVSISVITHEVITGIKIIIWSDHSLGEINWNWKENLTVHESIGYDNGGGLEHGKLQFTRSGTHQLYVRSWTSPEDILREVVPGNADNASISVDVLPREVYDVWDASRKSTVALVWGAFVVVVPSTVKTLRDLYRKKNV